MKCPGGHITKRYLQEVFRDVLEEAGIYVPGRGIHSLKHSRLTEVAMKTKDPYLVKELGRHASISMSDHYVRYVKLAQKVDEIGGRS